MIRRLNKDDLPAIHAVINPRLTWQTEVIDLARRAAIVNHLIDTRINVPAFVFFGSFNDTTGELEAFASFNRMPVKDNFNIGAAWAIPGLPRFEGSHSPKPLVEIRNFGLQFFRNEHMTTAWNVRPNHPNWTRPGGSDLVDPTKYKQELYCVLQPNQKMDDPALQIAVMLDGTLPTEQAIYKFTDLNPIPWPTFISGPTA